MKLTWIQKEGLKSVGVFLGAILILIIAIFTVASIIGGVESRRAAERYEVWVKVTGNTRELTYEEWRSLDRKDYWRSTK